MTLFLVITSVINIGLGYALAVYLGRMNSQWQPRLDVPHEEVAASAPEETSAEAPADEGNDDVETPQFVPPTAEEIEAAQAERDQAAEDDAKQADDAEETVEKTAEETAVDSEPVEESSDGEDASDDSEGAVEGEQQLEAAAS